MKEVILIVVFVLVFQETSSQSFTNFTDNDGLPSNEVYHVCQDSKGYVWFATDNGVCRFDGKQFCNFNMSSGLPDNTIFEIYEDIKGRIWFVSFSSKLSYFLNDSIYVFPYNNMIHEMVSIRPFPVKRSFIVDKNDNVFVSIYKEGVFVISKEGLISKYNVIPSNDSVNVIYFSNDSLQLAASTNSSMKNYQLGYSNGSDYKHLYKTTEYENAYGHMFNIKSKSMGKVFTKGKFMFFPDMINIEPVIFDKEIIWADVDKQDNIRLGFRGGGTMVINEIIPDFEQIELSDYSITSTCLDESNGIWYSTIENGVFYKKNLNSEIKTFKSDNSSSEVECMTIDYKENIWLGGSFGNLSKINTKSNLTKTYEFAKTEFINDIMIDWNNQMWLITSKNLYRHDLTKNKRFIPMTVDSISLDFFAGNRLIPGKDSSIWVIGTKSFTKLSVDNTILYDTRLNGDDELRIDGFYEDENGTILLGTLKGLVEFNNDVFYPIYEKHQLLRSRVIDIEKINDSYILGTKGVGLVILNNDTIFNFRIEDGLSSNSITSLYFDGEFLWTGTNKGLNKITLDRKGSKIINIENIYSFHGLISNNIKDISKYNSDIFITTDKGVSVFPKGELNKDKYKVPVYINNVEVVGLKTPIVDTIVIPYEKNSLKFSYIGLSYSYNDLLRYKYRLKGLDDNWQIIKKTHVLYPFIPHGDYVFEVYAVNPDGYESKEPAYVNIKILPPYWRELWFRYFILFLIGFTLILSLFGLKNSHFIKRKGRKKFAKINFDLRDDVIVQLDMIKERLLYQQISPHFIFNALNSVRNFILQNEKTKSSLFLEEFSKLMRKVVEFTNLSFLEIEEEIIFLEHYLRLESIRFDNKFKYKIEMATPGIELYRIPPMIIQPFVENAIWHAFDDDQILGSLLIKFIKDDRNIVCIVKDNGSGFETNFEKKKKTKSFGVSVTKKRINLINSMYGTGINVCFGDELIMRKHEYGTLIEIRMPLFEPLT